MGFFLFVVILSVCLFVCLFYLIVVFLYCYCCCRVCVFYFILAFRFDCCFLFVFLLGFLLLLFVYLFCLFWLFCVCFFGGGGGVFVFSSFYLFLFSAHPIFGEIGEKWLICAVNQITIGGKLFSLYDKRSCWWHRPCRTPFRGYCCCSADPRSLVHVVILDYRNQ